MGLAKGFTLIELLVVLAIVATLLLMVAPRYLNHLEASREAVLKENLHTVRQVIDKFYADKGRYPESLEEMVEARYLRSLPTDPITEATDTWQIIPVPEDAEGQVYDIRSGAQGTALNGDSYDQW
jgi:general secretion pathway protein G